MKRLVGEKGNPWARKNAPVEVEFVGDWNQQDQNPQLKKNPKVDDPWPIEALDTGREVAYMSQMEKDTILEYNKARYNPQKYSEEVLKPYMVTLMENVPDDPEIEWVAEAINFVSDQDSQFPLHPSKGLTLAARFHANELASRQDAPSIGHKGLDGSTSRERMDRYGRCKGYMGSEVIGSGENIYYGPNVASHHVRSLIIDYKFDTRGHRKTIFRKEWHKIGVGIAESPFFGFINVQDFATDFVEK